MGFFFRFQNLNPILYRIYKSRFHTQSHNLRLIQALAASQLCEHHRPWMTPSPADSPTYKIPKRWHVGHSHHNDRSSKEGENIFRLGLAADIGLATGKALTGYISGSTAIIADAAHSISDVVTFLRKIWCASD